MESNDRTPAESVMQDRTEVIAPTPSFSWQASEYVAHDKSGGWYLMLWGAAAAISAVLVLLKQWSSIAVVVVVALAVSIYSRKEPRVLEYAIDEHGISINGRLSPYNHFRSFSVLHEVGWREIDLEPSQRFAPRLTLLCEDDGFDQIEAILSQHLPRFDRDPDWIERLSRYLKF